ncbi:MAG: sulfotransferase [Pseudomonadota bacterium]
MARPLFILTPARSFSSVISAMIGNHPELMGLAETHLFFRDTYEDMHNIYRARPQTQDGLLRVVAELGLGEQSEVNIEAARALLEENRHAPTADIFADLADWAGPRELVDKSPMYLSDVKCMQRMHAAFPEARYLHITRHPRSTCDSLHQLINAPGRQKKFVKPEDMTPEKMWLEPHLRVLEFAQSIEPDQYMRLRGEVLMEQPEVYLQQIAEWLGISSSQTAVEKMLHPENSPFSRFGPENARFGNDPKFLGDPKLRPYKAKQLDLEEPMSWDPSVTFSEMVVQYAYRFGYG